MPMHTHSKRQEGDIRIKIDMIFLYQRTLPNALSAGGISPEPCVILCMQGKGVLVWFLSHFFLMLGVCLADMTTV